MKAKPRQRNFIPIVAIVALTFGPLGLSLVGSGLASVFNCHGASELSCSAPALNGVITALVVSAYLMYLTVPLGLIVFVIWAMREDRKAAAAQAVPAQKTVPDPERMQPATLADTWYRELSFADVKRHTTDPQFPDWPCAINPGKKILFTQLKSDTGLMRDGYYEYLLAVGQDLIIISLDDNGARVIPTGAWQKFKPRTIVELANEGATIVTYAQQPLRWNAH